MFLQNTNQGGLRSSISSDEIYKTVVNLACDMAKLITRERVLDNKIPFALLYEQMIYRKEITPLSGLGRDIKLKYWNETKGNRFERILQAQSLYVYDLMMEQ